VQPQFLKIIGGSMLASIDVANHMIGGSEDTIQFR
jgi:hypothetical protein